MGRNGTFVPFNVLLELVRDSLAALLWRPPPRSSNAEMRQNLTRPSFRTHGVQVEFIQMDTTQILAEIDSEIRRLEEVRALLAATSTKAHSGPRKKRHLSAEARERIAAAQRKRWAKQKKAAT